MDMPGFPKSVPGMPSQPMAKAEGAVEAAAQTLQEKAVAVKGLVSGAASDTFERATEGFGAKYGLSGFAQPGSGNEDDGAAKAKRKTDAFVRGFNEALGSDRAEEKGQAGALIGAGVGAGVGGAAGAAVGGYTGASLGAGAGAAAGGPPGAALGASLGAGIGVVAGGAFGTVVGAVAGAGAGMLVGEIGEGVVEGAQAAAKTE